MSSVAPQKVVRRVEWSKDRFELGAVRFDDDVARVEAEPLPPALLEPIWAFRADQREDAARGSRPLEFKDCARIGWNAGGRHGQLGPTVDNRERMEKSGAYVGTRASGDKNASKPRGRLYADELSRSGAEVNRKPAAACGHLQDPPSVDLELREYARMNRLGLADGVPELWFELIYHRPEQCSPEPVGRVCLATGGRFVFTDRDASQVLGRQPSNIFDAVALPARRSGGSSLEVIHF